MPHRAILPLTCCSSNRSTLRHRRSSERCPGKGHHGPAQPPIWTAHGQALDAGQLERRRFSDGKWIGADAQVAWAELDVRRHCVLAVGVAVLLPATVLEFRWSSPERPVNGWPV